MKEKKKEEFEIRQEQIDEKIESGQEVTEEELLKKPKKGRKIASIIVNTILIIAIILAAVCTYISYVSTSGNGVPSIFGIRILSIQTDSMYPEINSGDLIFDTAVKDSSDLEVGDIITYWTIIDGERALNTHRITEIYDGGDYLIFQTKGDNNEIEDSLTVHESEVVGIYTGKKIGGLGKVFDYLQTSTGFLLVVVIPVAIFFIYHLIQFLRTLFEYNNVKNRLAYELERGKAEDAAEAIAAQAQETREAEKQQLEDELRAKIMAEMAQQEKARKEAEERARLETQISQELEAEQKAKAEEGSEPQVETAQEEDALRAEIEAEIRAQEEEKARQEAQRKAEEEAKAAQRARLEEEIRAKILAEMAAEDKDSKE